MSSKINKLSGLDDAINARNWGLSTSDLDDRYESTVIAAVAVCDRHLRHLRLGFRFGVEDYVMLMSPQWIRRFVYGTCQLKVERGSSALVLFTLPRASQGPQNEAEYMDVDDAELLWEVSL